MMINAARMRRWMLGGMPVIWLCSLAWHAGGGAAGLGAWLGMGLLCLPRDHYPYPRRRGRKPERLFFALCLGWLPLAAGSFLSALFGPGGPFFHLGSACLAAVLCARGWTAPLSGKKAWLAGIFALLLCLLLIGYRP